MSDNEPGTSVGHTGSNAAEPNRAVPTVIPDANLIVEEPYRSSLTKVCIGLLYSKADAAIATRFKTKFESHAGVKVLRFHDDYTPPPGDPKVDEIADFSQHCDAFIWLATENSVQDYILGHHRAFCQHKSLLTPDKIFMCGIPLENPSIKIPGTLEAYTPMIEDDKFTQRVGTTVKYLLGKMERSSQQRIGSSRPVAEIATTSINPSQNLGNQQDQQILNFNINMQNCQIDLMQLAGEHKHVEIQKESKDAGFKTMEFDSKRLNEFDHEGQNENKKQSTDTGMPGDGQGNTTQRKEGDDDCNSPERKRQT